MISVNSETELLKQNYYTTSGTVLKRKSGVRGEQSLLLFLKGWGIVWGIAPFASSKNRFGGATEPMIWSVFTLYKSPNRLYVKNAEVKEDFISIRKAPVKLSAAIELYKILPKVLYIDHENDNVLKLLWNCMLLLEHGAETGAVKFRFYWRLLRLLGIAPSLTSCVVCGAELKSGAVVTIDGLVCKQCISGGRELSKEILSMLQTVALLPQNEFLSCERDKSTQIDKECDYLMSFFALNR